MTSLLKEENDSVYMIYLEVSVNKHKEISIHDAFISRFVPAFVVGVEFTLFISITFFGLQSQSVKW